VRDELKKSLFLTMPAPLIGVGLIAPLCCNAPLQTNVLLGYIATISLIVTTIAIAFAGMRVPVNVRPGTAVLAAAGVLTIAKLIVGRSLQTVTVPFESLSPLLLAVAVAAVNSGAYEVKKKMVPAVFDGMGIGICFMVLLCACGTLRDYAGKNMSIAFFIVAGIVVCIGFIGQRKRRSAP
jgi:Na+-translocating ferredoxin:NAD+ oxidoreductase subunit E